MRSAARLTAQLLLGLALAACSDASKQATPMVTGRVIDFVGRPMVHLTVATGDGNTWTTVSTTDVSGRFTHPRPAAAYDLAVIDGDGSAKVFLGVTRPDPLVEVSGVGDIDPGANVAVLALTTPPLCQGEGCPESMAGVVGFDQVPSSIMWFQGMPSDAFFDFTSWLDWEGPESLEGRYVALLWNTIGPLAYTAYSQEVVLEAGRFSRLEVPGMQPAELKPVAGRIEADPGVALGGVFLGHWVGGRAFNYLGAQAIPAEESFRFDVPVVGGVHSQVFVVGEDGSGGANAGQSSVEPGNEGLVLRLRSAPTQLEPASGATGIGVGTRFAWAPRDAVLHCVFLGASSLCTTGSELRLPDLTPLGFDYSADPLGFWQVYAIGVSVDVDAALAPDAKTGPIDFWNAWSPGRSLRYR